jgi:hypothetical protein
LQYSPENLSLRNNLALSLAVSGQTSEAVDMLRAMAYQPAGSARIRQNLALTHAVAGDLEQAESIAAHDLKGAALLRQLAFLRSLSGLSGAELASAMMCACAPGSPRGRQPEAGSATEFSSLAPATDQVAAAAPRRSQSAASSKRRSRMVARGKWGGSGNRRLAALTTPRVAEVLNGSKTLVVVRDADQAVSPEAASEPHASVQQSQDPGDSQGLADMQASLAGSGGKAVHAERGAEPDGS